MSTREIDDALERAYVQRATRERGTRTGLRGPHFGRSVAETRDTSPALTVRWPEAVDALERLHGDRFEAMADSLLSAAQSGAARVVLFTSCQRAEGRTTLVLALAKRLALRPVRSVVVDADLGGPMIASGLGLGVKTGLEDVVERGRPVEEALVELVASRVWVLPLRADVGRPRAFLGSPEWSCLMARLRRTFDLVLLDGSPLFTGLSAALLHRGADAAILVYHRGRTSERMLLRAEEVLDAGGVPLLGLAETFA